MAGGKDSLRIGKLRKLGDWWVFEIWSENPSKNPGGRIPGEIDKHQVCSSSESADYAKMLVSERNLWVGSDPLPRGVWAQTATIDISGGYPWKAKDVEYLYLPEEGWRKPVSGQYDASDPFAYGQSPEALAWRRQGNSVDPDADSKDDGDWEPIGWLFELALVVGAFILTVTVVYAAALLLV